MSAGTPFLVLLLLFSDGFASSAPEDTAGNYDYHDTKAPNWGTTASERIYDSKDKIQPAYSCKGDIGSMVKAARRDIGNIPDEWTTWQNEDFNVTVRGLSGLVEDRPFLAFCKDGLSTIKLSLASKALRAVVHCDCLGIGEVTFKVGPLRVEVDYGHNGTCVDSSVFRYKVEVGVRDMRGVAVEDYGWRMEARVVERLFFAFHDVIERLLTEAIEDAIRYNLRGSSRESTPYYPRNTTYSWRGYTKSF